MTLAEVQVKWSVILMDRLGPDNFSTLQMKGHVLQRARVHLKVPGCSLIWTGNTFSCALIGSKKSSSTSFRDILTTVRSFSSPFKDSSPLTKVEIERKQRDPSLTVVIGTNWTSSSAGTSCSALKSTSILVNFGSWSYNSQFLDVHPRGDSADLSSWVSVCIDQHIIF